MRKLGTGFLVILTAGGFYAAGAMGQAPSGSSPGATHSTSPGTVGSSPTVERVDASWCRSAGLNANDMRGCISRMNVAATDQQRADIQSMYRSRLGSGAATRHSGGGSSLNPRLDSGLSLGAGVESDPTSSRESAR